jgi:hypothetical protein
VADFAWLIVGIYPDATDKKASNHIKSRGGKKWQRCIK